MRVSANWAFRLRAVARRPWVRVGLYSLGGVLAALAAAVLQPLVPAGVSAAIGSEAVDAILSVLASSMLPVATFSLATVVQAYGSATQNATPRAVSLLMQDTRAQSAVATFVGAFVYSLVATIALKTSIYGQQGRVILFALTLVVIALVVGTLVRWIDALSHLGRVGETIDAIEAAATAAVRGRAERPHLGGLPWAAAPAGSIVVHAQGIGYVQHIDAARLDRLGETHGLVLHVDVLPGSFVHPGRSLVAIDGAPDRAALAEIARAFVVGDRRTFEEDPRFGIIALSEVASRALSPAVNDPGTAIDVVGTLVRVLAVWADRRAAAPQAEIYPRLRVRGLTALDLFDDAFTPIARDGAEIVEVGIRLQKALAVLAGYADPDLRAAAHRHADRALARARGALDLPDDVAAIERARGIDAPAGAQP